MNEEIPASNSSFYVGGKVKILQERNVNPDILKVVVRPDENLYFYYAQLPTLGHDKVEFLDLNKQSLTLAGVIEDVVERWNLALNTTDFCLQFDETGTFITNENKSDIKNGSILRLSVSVHNCVSILLEKLNSVTVEDEQRIVLELMIKHCRDVTFVSELLNQDGVHKIGYLVEHGKCSGRSQSLVLHSFAQLMEHGLVSWDVVSEPFVVRVASYVTGRAKHEDHSTLTAALNILEAIVSNSKERVLLVQREVLFDTLIRHLDKSDASVQRNTLALMNALLIKAKLDEKRRIVLEILTEKPVRSALETNILKRNVAVAGTELAHQLGVLQRLLFNFTHSRAILKLSDSSTSDMEKLHDLRRTAFESTGELPTSPSQSRKVHSSPQNTPFMAKEFRKLGFLTPEKPTVDLDETPPGVLALDCMLHFAKQHLDVYSRMILESSLRTDGHGCPFAVVSIELVKILIELLRLDQQPREQGESYHELFFKRAKPFEEFFSVCLKRLYKTWSEMHATVDDVSKVISVVREQVNRTLQLKPITLELFHEEINRMSYSEIQTIWQNERLMREESEFQAKPIRDLRQEVRPQMLELVKSNRLNVMKRGKIFQKFGRGGRGVREKGKFWFWKLSNNAKTLHFADCDETTVPERFEEIKQRVSISEIKDVALTRDCPHVKESKSSRKAAVPYAFSLVFESDESFNFIASDEETFQAWTDGLCALLNKPIPSKRAADELDTLVNFEMKIRLLDLEGLSIPNVPPPIPPLPADFDFAYN